MDSANGVGYDAWVDFSCCDEERYFFNQRRGLDDKKEGEDQVMRAGEDDKPGSRRSPAALFRYVVRAYHIWLNLFIYLLFLSRLLTFRPLSTLKYTQAPSVWWR